MNLEIRHLELVVAITEEKSVTKAAERLFLTQSALSHQLKEIETRLGTQLFLRIKKRMILTVAGKTLLNSARKILSDLKNTEDEILRIAADKKGSVRLSTECYTCYHWLPPLLKKFSRTHPEIEVEIVVEATRNPISALLEGRLDLAVTSFNDYGEDKNLNYDLLFEDEMLVILSPDHKLSGRGFIKPKDFSGENLIIYGELAENSVYKRFLMPAGIEPGRVSQVQLTEAIIEMVRANLGIGVLARWAVESYLQTGAIAGIPLTKAGFKRQWFAVTLKSPPQPSYLKEFIGLISDSRKSNFKTER